MEAGDLGRVSDAIGSCGSASQQSRGVQLDIEKGWAVWGFVFASHELESDICKLGRAVWKAFLDGIFIVRHDLRRIMLMRLRC
jgi:hypothetical protein